jgi:hypothetical protein
MKNASLLAQKTLSAVKKCSPEKISVRMSEWWSGKFAWFVSYLLGMIDKVAPLVRACISAELNIWPDCELLYGPPFTLCHPRTFSLTKIATQVAWPRPTSGVCRGIWYFYTGMPFFNLAKGTYIFHCYPQLPLIEVLGLGNWDDLV